MAQTRVDRDELLGSNPLPDFNEDERRYGVHVRNTLMKLLKGEHDTLDLLAKYYREPNRLGALPLPATVDPRALRLSKVEEILSSTIRFLHDGSEGGPTAQWEDTERGVTLLRRDFPTRFPHIVIERTDTFDAQKGEPIESTWCVHRLQNQRRNVLINRALDAMNLGLELLRLAR
ncbi:MAG: hypothetical protein ACM3US_11080 [Sphingomonadaceae bacterium]